TLQAWPLVEGFPNGLAAGLGDDGWFAGAPAPVAWVAGVGLWVFPRTGVFFLVSSALRPTTVPPVRMSATKPRLRGAQMLIGRISLADRGSDTAAATLAAGDPHRACSLSPSSAYGLRPHRCDIETHLQSR